MNVLTSLLTTVLAAIPITPVTPVTPVGPVAPSQTADPCGLLTEQRVVPCFSDPTTNDPWIFDSLAAIVDTAGEGDSIEIMMYSWRTGELPQRLADKVVQAYQRGVDVRVILDEASEPYEPIETLRAAEVPLVVCDDEGNFQENCLMVDDPDYYDPSNDQPMNHTKLLLFDIDGQKMVVGGSANLGDSDYYFVWNDMVRIRDAALHAYLSQWFERVWSDDWQGWDDDDNRWGVGDPATGPGDLAEMAYLYPRLTNDPIANTLGKTTACDADGDGDGDWDKRVWAAISSWSTDGRADVLDQLVRLDEAGCDVRVLVGEGIEQEWVDTMRERLSGDASDDSQVRRGCDVHHKLLVLDAEYEDAYHELVVTGSDIWTNGSLHYSTELNLRIGGEDEDTDDGAVRAYIEHYDKLWDDHSVPSCSTGSEAANQD